MDFLSIFSSKEIDEMAQSLANELAKRYPPALDSKEGKKLSAIRITRILEDLYDRATLFQRERKLGLYKKARLSNTFKWALKEQGYSSAFIDMATEGLVVYMTRKAPLAVAQKETINRKTKKKK